jgi:hypothetical protein
MTLPASWDENWYSSPVIYDLESDGSKEVIAAQHSVLYVWNANGSKKWRAPVGQPASSSNDHGSARIYSSPVVGDLDRDGRGEIAIAYGKQVAVYDHDGNLHSGWPQTFPGPDGELRSIAAGDLDADGAAEIVFTTYSTAGGLSALVILSSFGMLLHRISIEGRGSMAAPTLDDVDGDGVIEIVLSLKDAIEPPHRGGVQIWDVASARKGSLDWPTGRGNYLRSGNGR